MATDQVPVPTVEGQNTLPKPPRITGNAQGDALTMLRWFNTFYDIFATTGQIQGTLLNHTARITNLEAAGGSGVTSFNGRTGAVVLTTADVDAVYTLPTASTTVLGAVKIDGTSVTIASGVISAHGTGGVTSFNTRTGAVVLSSGDVTTALGFTPGPAYTLPIATASVLGGIKPDGSTITVNASTGVATATGGGGGSNNFIASGLSVPSASAFAWINQGGSAAANQSSGPLTLTAPASGSSNLRFFGESIPASAPWTATAEIAVNMSAASYHYAGIAISDGTQFTIFTVLNQANTIGLYVQNWSSSSSLVSTLYGNGWFFSGPVVFLRIYNDGTNYNYQISGDGVTYTTVATQAVAAFLTATKVGFLMENQDASNFQIVMNVWGWEAVTGTGTVLTW